MRQEILGLQFDEERALYHLQNTDVVDCGLQAPQTGNRC